MISKRRLQKLRLKDIREQINREIYLCDQVLLSQHELFRFLGYIRWRKLFPDGVWEGYLRWKEEWQEYAKKRRKDQERKLDRIRLIEKAWELEEK